MDNTQNEQVKNTNQCNQSYPLDWEDSFVKTHENGENIHFVRSPINSSKPILVFCPGMSSTLYIYVDTVIAMQSKFNIVIFEYPGCGQSTYQDPLLDVQHASKKLKYFLTAMNISKFHLLGTSLGGLLVLDFCFSYPDMVQGIILYQTFSLQGFNLGKVIDNQKELNTWLSEDPPNGKVFKAFCACLEELDKERAFQMICSIFARIAPELDAEPEKRDFFFREFLKSTLPAYKDTFLAYQHCNLLQSDTPAVQGSCKGKQILAKIYAIHGVKDILCPLTQLKELAAMRAPDQTFIDEIEWHGHMGVIIDPIFYGKTMADNYCKFMSI